MFNNKIKKQIEETTESDRKLFKHLLETIILLEEKTQKNEEILEQLVNKIQELEGEQHPQYMGGK